MKMIQYGIIALVLTACINNTGNNKDTKAEKQLRKQTRTALQQIIDSTNVTVRY